MAYLGHWLHIFNEVPNGNTMLMETAGVVYLSASHRRRL